MNVLKVIIPGLLSTIQDGGRKGYMALGFSQCGAMDSDSMTIANLLVGNDMEDAVVEMTLMGLSAVALSACVVAVVGEAEVFINGKKADCCKAIALHPHDYITVGQITCRAYLAVRGGIDVPQAMGSRSTFLKIGMGGMDGRRLQAGDILPARAMPPLKKLRAVKCPVQSSQVVLRAIAGPQEDMFSREEVEKFFRREYTVTPASDRMGIRLTAEEAIVPLDGSDIISDGIVLGSVQVPKNGQPIILCADRQTTGGYAKIATVITADMPKCGQLSVGAKVRFEKVSVKQAQKIRKKKMKYFKHLQK